MNSFEAVIGEADGTGRKEIVVAGESLSEAVGELLGRVAAGGVLQRRGCTGLLSVHGGQ